MSKIFKILDAAKASGRDGQYILPDITYYIYYIYIYIYIYITTLS